MRYPRLLFLIVITTTAGLAVPGAALAAVRSGMDTFDPNPQGPPSFNPPPQYPNVTLTVSYDDAGTLTLRESPVVSQNGGTVGDAFFPDVDITGGAGTPTLHTTPGEGEHLEDGQVSGTLNPQETDSPDGSTITYTWSNPLLAHLNLTFIRVSPNDFSPPFAGGFYFPGYEPHVVMATPGVQTGQVRIDVSLRVHATEVGVAQDDQNGSGITAYRASGLPPGVWIDPRSGIISGTPSKSGSFAPTITAIGGYNTQYNTADRQFEATQSTATSTTFKWTIAPLPTPVRCSNSRISTGRYSARASGETAAGIRCSTVHAWLRRAAIWRGGLIAFGGIGRNGPRVNPPGWTCRQLTEYFATRDPRRQDDGSLTGSVTRCDSGDNWFRVTMGRVTRWRRSV